MWYKSVTSGDVNFCHLVNVTWEESPGISTAHSHKLQKPLRGPGGADVAFITHITGALRADQQSRTLPPWARDLFEGVPDTGGTWPTSVCVCRKRKGQEAGTGQEATPKRGQGGNCSPFPRQYTFLRAWALQPAFLYGGWRSPVHTTLQLSGICQAPPL